MASLSKEEQRRKGKGTMPLLLLLPPPPEHPACRADRHRRPLSSSRLIVGPGRTTRARGTDAPCQRRRLVAPFELEGSRMGGRGVKWLAAAARGVGQSKELLSLHHLWRPPGLPGWLFSPPYRPRGTREVGEKTRQGKKKKKKRRRHEVKGRWRRGGEGKGGDWRSRFVALETMLQGTVPFRGAAAAAAAATRAREELSAAPAASRRSSAAAAAAAATPPPARGVKLAGAEAGLFPSHCNGVGRRQAEGRAKSSSSGLAMEPLSRPFRRSFEVVGRLRESQEGAGEAMKQKPGMGIGTLTTRPKPTQSPTSPHPPPGSDTTCEVRTLSPVF